MNSGITVTPPMTRQRAQEIAAGFDLRALPPEFYTNPYPVYRVLRETEPVRAMPDGSFFLSRHADLVAVYRDASGELHEKSAVCPHLGCIVVWNAAEKTWDCPCHGSRFGKFGDVINGPANTGLARL